MEFKPTIQVLGVNRLAGTSKKTNAAYELFLAQCVLESTDGQVVVGEAMLPKELKDTKPGRYTATWQPMVGMDKRITAQLVRLDPVANVRAAA